MLTTGVNVAFLRSGKQFGAVGAKASPTAACLPANMSSTERLARFFAQTQQAALEAKQRRERQEAMAATTICGLNLNFIRSGQQFLSTPEAFSEIDDVVEMPTPHSLPQDRLRSFYEQTVRAAAAASGKAQEQGHTINIDFIRSGGQFLPAPWQPEAREVLRPSADARLRSFYAETASAAARAAHTARGHSARAAQAPARKRPTPTTVVNLAFLRSGMEFSPSNSERDPRDEEERQTNAGGARSSETRSTHARASPAGAGARRTRAQRLEDFYQKTLAAASPRAARKMRSAVGTGQPTLVNVKFLQSGHEFSPGSLPASGAGGARKSKARRLEEFYQQTLAAASPRMARKMRSQVEATATLVNLKFLRSGKEFQPAGLPEFDESGSIFEEEAADNAARLQNAGHPSRPAGPKTTQAERLKRFYTSTLQAAAAAGSKAVASQ